MRDVVFNGVFSSLSSLLLPLSFNGSSVLLGTSTQSGSENSPSEDESAWFCSPSSAMNDMLLVDSKIVGRTMQEGEMRILLGLRRVRENRCNTEEEGALGGGVNRVKVK